MGGALTIAIGALLGLVGSVPPAYLFEQALKRGRSVSVGAGLVSILVSFTLLTGSLLLAWVVSRESVLPLGCAEAASLLLVWVVEAWRAWKDANAPASSGERKSGEPTG